SSSSRRAAERMDSKAFNDAVAAIKGDLGAFLPETILSVFVCVLLLWDLFGKAPRPKAAGLLALTGVLLASLALLSQKMTPARDIFSGMMRIDAFGGFFKGLILA